MKRKTTTMLVTISYPVELYYGRKMTAAMARREVRTLIGNQSNYLDGLDTHDIKVRAVRAVAK